MIFKNSYYPALMNEHELYIAVDTLLQKYKKYADMAEAQSENPTNLRLKVCRQKNHYQCYLVDRTTKKKRYAPAKSVTVMRIAQVDYNQKILKLLNGRIRMMTDFLNELKKNSPCNAKDELTEGRRRLISPSFADSDISVEKWLSEEYEKKGFYSDENIQMTEKGERVRSKSEVLIANELFKRNIPYKYERPIMLDGITYHPDFTILNPQTGREVIWEHFGLIDDSYYRDEMVRKLRVYESNGYYLGVNLFITFETNRMQMNLADINSTINKIVNCNS